VVRVWAGDAKTKGNPLAESTGFLGSSLAAPGGSNVDWSFGSTVTTGALQNGATSVTPGNSALPNTTGASTTTTTPTPTTPTPVP
jgi:hypothetical protein